MGEKLTTFLWICYAVVNVIAFVLMGIDKGIAAANGKSKTDVDKRRIPEKRLFLFPVLFGGVGGTLGMYFFRHKTKHWYFAIFFPLLAVLQVAALVYLGFFA